MKKICKVVCLFLLLFTLFACDKKEIKPETINVLGQLQEYYGKGVDIDLNSITIEITYTNQEKKEYSLFDEEVTHDEFDTSVVGKKTINVSCLGLHTTIEYEVVEYTLILDFQDGSYENATVKSLVADNNLIDITDIVPTPNDETKEFAGWFYDKELTKRANPIMNGVYLVNENITLYAGYDTCYDSLFQYTITEDDEVILNFCDLFSSMDMAELVIPATIKLYPVVEIADDFIDESLSSYVWWLTKITFPEDSKVRTIGKRSFVHLPISELELPNTLERIDDEAFSSTQIQTLKLPKSIKYIGEKAFSGCAFLLNVDFNDSELLTIGNYAFANCVNLITIELSNKVETIGSYAFSSCFELYEVNISKSVISIGLGTFANLPRLKNIFVDEDNQNFSSVDGNLLSKNGKIFYRYCYGKEETTYSLPSTVEVLFEACFDITSETSSLKTLILNEGLIEISSEAFKKTSLDFTIPSTVERVGYGAFYEWKGAEFKVSEDNKYFKTLNKCLVSKDGTILYAVPSNIEEDSFYLPDSIKEIKSYAIGQSQTIKTIIIGENSQLEIVDEYGINPFYMTNLNALVILRDTPFSIADNAFTGDSSSILNDTFVIVVKSDYIDAYKNAWKDYSSFIDRDILGFITDPTSYYNRLLTELSDFAYVTSVNAFYKYNKFLLAIEESSKFIIIKKIEAIDSLLSIFSDVNEKNEYVIALFEEWANQQLSYFTQADNNTLTSPAYSYKTFKNVYNAIPNEVKEKFVHIAQFDEQINALDTRYNELQKNRNEVLSQLLDFNFTNDSFDNEKYLALIDLYNEYAVYNMILGDSQSLKLNILDCSQKMYQLLNYEYTLDNLSNIYDIFYGNELDVIFGVKQYLTSYLDQPVYYNQVYKIEKLDEIENKIIKLLNDSIESVSNFYLNYEHPETYNKEKYEQDLLVYEKLGANMIQCDGTVIAEYQKLLARKIMNDFIEIAKKGINEENLYDLSSKADLLVYYLYNESISIFISGVQEYSEYEQYLEQYNELYNDKINNVVDLINQITSDDILTTYQPLKEEYEKHNQFYSTVLLNVSGYSISIYDLNNIIECAYMIKKIIETAPTIDNYEEMFNMINGENGIEEKLETYQKSYYFADIFEIFMSDEDYVSYKNLLKDF